MARSARIPILVSPPAGVSLGTFMNEIRTWLDGQKIQSGFFRATTDVVGFAVEIGIEREEYAERFRERFNPV
jgi:hypothetical protein